MNTAENVLILLTHRERIEKATNFEEFKSAQLHFLDYLIESFESKHKKEEAMKKFLEEM